MDATPGRTEAEPMIRLAGVGKTYADGTVAVQELDLEVGRGELVCLVGPSGCGKSTTLKMINRLIEPTTGTIEIDGRDVIDQDPVKLRRGIGYVIQQVGLFPHQKIVKNVMTVPLLYGESKATARSRAVELMELVGLDPATYADRYPHQLSGGQRQRVGVARALAADPPVLLMDEPFGAVDPVVRTRLQDEFLRLQRELGKTVVLVTHDIDEAVRMGDRVAIFAVGGRLAQYGTPAELLAHPADDFVADFVGSTKGLRRLTVTPIDPAHLEPLDGISTGDLAGAIGVDATLEEALAALLRDDKQVIGVRDGAHVRRRAHPQRHPPRPAGVAERLSWASLGLELRLARRVDANEAPLNAEGGPTQPSRLGVLAELVGGAGLCEGLPGGELGAQHVGLLLELGEVHDRLGGALLGVLETAGEALALLLGEVGTAGLGVALAGGLGGPTLRADQGLLQLCRAVSRCSIRPTRVVTCTAFSSARSAARAR